MNFIRQAKFVNRIPEILAGGWKISLLAGVEAKLNVLIPVPQRQGLKLSSQKNTPFRELSLASSPTNP